MTQLTGLEPLTPVQQCCAGVIAEFHETYGRAPTFDEIRRELDMKSKGGVAALIAQLARKGWLKPRRRASRYTLALTVAAVPLPPESSFDITDAGRQAIGGFLRGQGSSGDSPGTPGPQTPGAHP